MKITKIEVQKKNKNRVNLFIDNQFYCGLSLETILKNRIKEGQDISLSQLEYLQINTEREVALSKTISYLSKSQKTKKEIYDYLRKKDFDEKIINYVIQKLEEYNLINDEIYAQNFIKYKTKTQGSRKIINNLRQKGVSDTIIQKFIFELSDDLHSIDFVAEKYLRNKSLDLKTKQKTYRYLLSKGYKYGDIIDCLNKFFKGD